MVIHCPKNKKTDGGGIPVKILKNCGRIYNILKNCINQSTETYNFPDYYKDGENYISLKNK